MYNPELMRLAQKKASARKKQAFVPGDPAAAAGGGGGMPMDPAMMGGAPPMDPAMMGGAPPMDPAMMGGGGMPPAAPPPPPPAPPAPQPATAESGGKPPKPDINTVANDIWQVKKMVEGIYHRNEWPLPQGLIDGPNRDPATGAAVPPGTPGSTSDMSAPTQNPAGGGGGAIPAIEPMEAASFGGGGEKSGSFKRTEVVGEPYADSSRTGRHRNNITTMSKAAAVARLVQGLAMKREKERASRSS